jgi:hypothetical protein
MGWSSSEEGEDVDFGHRHDDADEALLAAEDVGVVIDRREARESTRGPRGGKPPSPQRSKADRVSWKISSFFFFFIFF